MKPWFLVSLAAALTSCVTVQAAPQDGSYVALGDAVLVDGLVVTPQTVIEDSRCPVNVRCIWAGRTIVRSLVRGGAWQRTIDLTLGEPQTVADGALALVSVTPGQRTGSEIPAPAYRFAFEFDGGL